MFEKAGKPEWAAIVPILQHDGADRHCRQAALAIIKIVFACLIGVGVAKNFGKGTGLALGLIFLSPIFYPILGFGEARYQKVA